VIATVKVQSEDSGFHYLLWKKHQDAHARGFALPYSESPYTRNGLDATVRLGFASNEHASASIQYVQEVALATGAVLSECSVDSEQKVGAIGELRRQPLWQTCTPCEGSPALRAAPTTEGGVQLNMKVADDDKESSRGTQIVHILFEKGHHQDILEVLQQVDATNPQAVYDELRKVTFPTPIEYGVHQDYDNFLFYYAWRASIVEISQRHNIELCYRTTPRLTTPLNVTRLKEVQEAGSSQRMRLVLRALVIRKHLALAKVTSRVQIQSLKREWDAASAYNGGLCVSDCW
jgi:hypothetical protein